MEPYKLQLTLSQTDKERMFDHLEIKEDERGVAQRVRQFIFEQMEANKSTEKLSENFVTFCEYLDMVIGKDKTMSKLIKEQLKSAIYQFALKNNIGKQLKLNF